MSLLKVAEMETLTRTKNYLESLSLDDSGKQVLADLTALIDACEETRKAHIQRTAESVKKYRQTDKGKAVKRKSAQKSNAKMLSRQREITALSHEIAEILPTESAKKREKIRFVKTLLETDPGAVLGAVEGYPDLIERIKSL